MPRLRGTLAVCQEGDSVLVSGSEDVPINEEGWRALSAEERRMRKQGMKECTEYVVIQRAMLGSRLREWVIWGTTGETDLEEAKRRAIEGRRRQAAQLELQKEQDSMLRPRRRGMSV